MAPIPKLLWEIERLEKKLEELPPKVAGFVWAYACDMLDKGLDPREEEIPAVLESLELMLMKEEAQ